MSQQLTDNAAALRLFLTEDIYLVKGQLTAVSTTEVVRDAQLASTNAAQQNDIEKPAVGDVSEPQVRNWDFKFIGKNQKKILILVNDEANDVSTELGREVLRNLVKAINLTGNDFALVNYAHYKQASFLDLKHFFECEVVLAFGVDCEHLKIPQSDLHKLSIYQQTKIVVTHRLDLLDATGKKQLWISLQQLKS